MTFVPDRLAKPTAANTAAVIVSFHPDEQFDARLARLSDQFPAVYWVDNTPGIRKKKGHRRAPQIHYLSRGKNVGLASALNIGCEAASNAGFAWVVTFDQDSDVTDDFLEQQIDCWRAADPLTFMLGCNYADSANADSPRFRTGNQITACPTVISSGCLMCLSAWAALGRFRGDYFIDGVDHEICLRGRSRGLVVARHGRVLMHHRIGERSVNYRLFPYLHSPVRKYYSMRNGFRNIIQYASSEPLWVARKCVTLAWEMVIALLVEPDKRRKFRAMIRGIHHGIIGKMGPAPNEFSD